MNDIIQNLEANATNGKENFCYISEKQLNAMKELSKREAKENKQLKDNWNKLKEYLHNQIPTDKTVLTKHIKIFEVLDKMQEIERSDNDE